MAVLLDFAGVHDLRTPFAAEWHFSFCRSGRHPSPILARSSISQMIARYAGCTIESHSLTRAADLHVGLSGSLPALPFLVFGDAYYMPWLPYCGNQHIDHSAIVTAIDGSSAAIVDAYLVKTEWGDAHPISTSVSLDALSASMNALSSEHRGIAWTIRRTTTPALDINSTLHDNANAILHNVGHHQALHSFADHFGSVGSELDSQRAFALHCWLAMRTRLLHRRWLLDLATTHPDRLPISFVNDFQENVVEPWLKASGFAYIALRRLRDGRSPTDAAFRLIVEQIAPAELAAAERLCDAIVAAPGLTDESARRSGC
ncbi:MULTISPECIES: hypothetical protein [unclassified Bradyrhizobium]|uniref:hypothetical protein n=1 Tax=unclassified Bradyrhizobium TaxID=2631580 RepID=UPI0029160C4C|nr:MULTISPECIES: hypothetical protein [unclassified Bradyrhizobium]